ncbi:MAG: methyltransferase [Polyangiaceae bacterium]|nr:methyltransferase [Polyangiaceae bacterium]MCW5789963.1 methyltransferase [Polyangiaceae bacterium]
MEALPSGTLSGAPRDLEVIAGRITALTEVAEPVLCPEISLRLATPNTPMWTAGQAQLDAWGCPEPYWAFAWPGGQTLGRALLDHPELVRGKSVLDLGSGGGIAALCALRAGARAAHAVDIDPWASVAVRLGCQLSQLPSEKLTTSAQDLIGQPVNEEVLLVGDLLYEAELAARLLPWLKAQAQRGVLVCIGDPGRGHVDLSALERVASYLAPTDAGLDGSTLKEASVYRLGAYFTSVGQPETICT